MNAPLIVGGTMVLISRGWFSEQCRPHLVKGSWGDVPAIDCQSILHTNNNGKNDYDDDGDDGTLKSNLVDQADYLLVPRAVAQQMLEWYGALHDLIERHVIAGANGTPIVEVYPCQYKVFRHDAEHQLQTVTVSRASTFAQFRDCVMQAVQCNSQLSRMWSSWSTQREDYACYELLDQVDGDAPLSKLQLKDDNFVMVECRSSADDEWPTDGEYKYGKLL